MKKTPAIPFNKVARTIRKRLHLTLEEFSKASGISSSTLYSFESGRRNISDELRLQIKNALIHALEDAERKEREGKLHVFRPLADAVSAEDPQLSSAVLQYCVGKHQPNRTIDLLDTPAR